MGKTLSLLLNKKKYKGDKKVMSEGSKHFLVMAFAVALGLIIGILVLDYLLRPQVNQLVS
jgi:hypothetical protein